MRAVGIILAGGNSNKMRELTHKRAVAAMPIAGSYRAIDFALSNMSNSHIQKVAVLTQYNARSLNEHLNSSKWWDFGRKQGWTLCIYPDDHSRERILVSRNGRCDLPESGFPENVVMNLMLLLHPVMQYTRWIITKCWNIILQRKQILQLFAKNLDPNEDASRFGTIKMNETMRIEEFEEKPMVAQSTRLYQRVSM